MKSPSLCVLPFLQFNILPTGVATLCCVSQEPLYDHAGKELSIFTHSFEEIWQSPTLNEVRQKMLSGEAISNCSGCFSKDCREHGSYRDEMNYKLLSVEEDGHYCVDFPDRFLDLCQSFNWLKPDFSVTLEQLKSAADGKPKSFDLRIDNKCNLKCVICSAQYSSQIELDPVHSAWSGGKRVAPTANRLGGTKTWVRNPQLAEEVKLFGDKARYIQLAGGEPFASRVCLAWINHMVETGQSRQVDLKVFTNLLNISQDISDALVQFRSVVLVVSIDAYGSQYEYVRYPGKWKDLEDNFAFVADLKGALGDKFEVYINYTLSRFTALSVRPLLTWAASRGLKVMLSYAVGPDYAGILALPFSVKTRVIAELQQISADLTSQMPYLPWFIDRLIRHLDETAADEAICRKFMRFVNDLDLSRGTDFHTTFPELSAEYKRYYGFWEGTGNQLDEIERVALLYAHEAKQEWLVGDISNAKRILRLAQQRFANHCNEFPEYLLPSGGIAIEENDASSMSALLKSVKKIIAEREQTPELLPLLQSCLDLGLRDREHPDFSYLFPHLKAKLQHANLQQRLDCFPTKPKAGRTFWQAVGNVLHMTK